METRLGDPSEELLELQSRFSFPRSTIETQPYVYAPLDHQRNSIRLIRIFNDSIRETSEISVRCEIRHGTTEDSYICLSYVWGPRGGTGIIRLNNKACTVRHNLLSFLKMARQKKRFQERWFWIDALCIDQQNIGERNHQVQQMGLIFSRAKEVVSWLGNEPHIAWYLDDLRMDPTAELMELDVGDDFGNVEYWRRAWITQEVVLAQKVTLFAGTKELDFGSIFLRFSNIPKKIAALSPWRKDSLKGRSLPLLISQLDLKTCHDRRDRIYSLLALCGDGSNLQVDYGTSIKSLGRNTLQCCKRSFCLCSIRIIAHVLAIQYWRGGSPSEDTCQQTLAYLTLPFIQGALPLRECARSCSLPHCDGTVWSHTPGFVQQLSPNDVPSITLYPSNICESSNRCQRILITAEKERSGYEHNIVRRYLARTTTQRKYQHHCKLVPSNDAYQVYFPFGFLVDMAYDTSSIEPCNRIIVQGTDGENSISEPILQLCA